MTEERPPGPNADEPLHGNGSSQLPAPLRVTWSTGAHSGPEPQRVWVEDGRRWSDRASWRVSARRINQLSLVIQALGIISILLGAVSAVVIWPRVRLLWLIAITGAGIVGGLAGVLLRGLHHRMLRELGREASTIRFYRTRVHRCRVGMFFCGLMLAGGVTLERALPNSRPPFAASVSDETDAELSAARGSRAEVVGPRQLYAEGDLRLRVASAYVEPADGRKPRLQVMLEASNAGRVVKLDLDRMQDIELPLVRMAVLSDDFDNRYQEVERPELVRDDDFSAPTSLYPGDRLRVRLVFEPPVSQARLLKLSIPGDSFKLSHHVIFEIDTQDLGKPKPASLEMEH